MTRFFKSRKADDEKRGSGPELELQTSDGGLQLPFSKETVTHIRQMIGRIETRQDIPRRIGMIASMREEGVTYITRATATTMANDLEATICIVDLNWWFPAEIGPLGKEGLGSVLKGERELDEVLISTNHSNLYLLPAGQIDPGQRASIVRSQRLSDILEQLAGRFDHLLFDIPAILAVSEAVPLTNQADACCLIVHQGVTSTSNVRVALDEVRHVNMLGVVLNQVKTHTPDFLLRLLPSE